MKKIRLTGLFFGSFNPIHMGHLIVAEYMCMHADLEEVWFIVSPQNPLKEKSMLLKDEWRMKMVKLAIKDNKSFSASDVEFRMPKPSYTVDTLEKLSEKFPKRKFALIMGSENLEQLPRWKDYEKILSHYPMLVFRRGFINEGEWKQFPGVIFFDTPFIKISSTLIRTMIADKHSVRYLLPDAVWKMVAVKKFYRKKNT